MELEEMIAQAKEKAEPALQKKPEDRTYEDRFEIWCYTELLSKRNPEKFHYDEGEEVYIYDGEKLAQNEIKDGFGNDFPSWFRECGNHFGEMVTASFDKNSYKLVGVMYTYMDYYYVLESDLGKRTLESCVGNIDYLE